MSGFKAAATPGDGAPWCLPEQNQGTDGGPTWAWGAEVGTEGVFAPGSLGTEGELFFFFYCFFLN